MENDNFIYSSAPIIPKIFLFFKNELLEENKDYELTYLNNINAGKATILVKGIDEYYGEKIIYFDIEKKDKPDCPINNIIISNNEKFLKDISLPNNYIWKNPDSLIQNKAIIIYIGKDKDNYFDNEFEISIIKQISSSNSSLPSTSSSTNIISSSTSFISSSNSISSSFTQPNDTSSSLSSSNLSISSNSQSSTSTSSQQNTSPSIDSKILIIILISGIISITAIFSIVIIITFKKGK
jgi:similar to uniprot